MATRKISLTIDETALDEIRASVGARGVSRFVDAAVREKIDRDERRAGVIAWLDELDRTDPPTPEELAAGEAQAQAIVRWAAG